MNVEDFLTQPPVIYKGNWVCVRMDNPADARIQNFRFKAHLQEVMKFPAMPLIFADHELGGFVTRCQWPNKAYFFVVNTFQITGQGVTRTLWSCAENKASVQWFDRYMKSMHNQCQIYHKKAIIVSNSDRVGIVSISEEGTDRVLTTDAERILRTYYGGFGGNISPTVR